VCVELDGHDYHKTKEQRTSDAQRQRWLEMNNWRVIRFTGTEVHKNVWSCVKQTIAFLNKVNETNGINFITGG
jgi:very-short-patch-repair endonuclease